MPLRLALALAVVLAVLPGFDAVKARQATPLPEGSASTPELEPLLDVTLPATALPPGAINVVLAHWAWEPGATASVPAGAWEVGIVIDHVLHGSYAATSGGDVAIVAGETGWTTREFAPGNEFVVEAGSGAVYFQNEATWKFRNAEETRGEGLGGGIFSTAAPTSNDPVSEIGILYTELAAVEVDQLEPQDADAFTFRYWRATLTPGQSIPPADENVIQLVGADPASPPGTTLTVAADGSARNDGSAPITIYGLTLAPAS